MTILVTGGAGYIGSHMVLELIKHNEDLVVLDDLSTGFPALVPKNVTFIKGDIGNSPLVSNIIKDYGINAVIHFAGSIIVPESITNPLEYYLNNTVKSRSLIADAINHGIKHFIFSSTAAVYGIPETNPIPETAPFQPISPYGSSKMMTEMMLKDSALAYDFSYVALRYFNVAGADPEGRSGQSGPKATHLIKVASQAVTGKRPKIQMFGTDYPTPDGTCIRDYIHVSDLAKAHKLALDYLRNGGESKVMNCGYGRGYSVAEVVEMVKAVSNIDFEAEKVGRRPGDPPELVAKVGTIKDTLNWVPDYNNLELIIRDAVNWEKKLN